MPCTVEREWRTLTAHSIETLGMFLRTVKVKRADGHIDEYVRLVESVWRKGRPEHRVISNLGRKDLLAPHAATLLRMLTGEHPPLPQADAVCAVADVVCAEGRSGLLRSDVHLFRGRGPGGVGQARA